MFQQRHLSAQRKKQKSKQPHSRQGRQQGQQKGGDKIEAGIEPFRIGRISGGHFVQRCDFGRTVRRYVQSHVVSEPKEFIIRLGRPARKAVFGLADRLIHAHADIAGKDIVSYVKIIPDFFIIGGPVHIHHENPRIHWQGQVKEPPKPGKTDHVPVHDIGNLRQFFPARVRLNNRYQRSVVSESRSIAVDKLPRNDEPGKKHQRQAGKIYPTTIHGNSNTRCVAKFAKISFWGKVLNLGRARVFVLVAPWLDHGGGHI
ncbi:MAG: hypothetical protein ABSF60_04995 [Verrucomicrobiota bacterium]